MALFAMAYHEVYKVGCGLDLVQLLHFMMCHSKQCCRPCILSCRKAARWGRIPAVFGLHAIKSTGDICADMMSSS